MYTDFFEFLGAQDGEASKQSRTARMTRSLRQGSEERGQARLVSESGPEVVRPKPTESHVQNLPLAR